MVIIVGAVSSLHPKSLRAVGPNSPTELTDYTEGFCVNAIWRKPSVKSVDSVGENIRLISVGDSWVRRPRRIHKLAMVIIVGAVSSLHPQSFRAFSPNSPTELTDYTEGFCVNVTWRKPFCEISGFCGRKYKINLCGRLLGTARAPYLLWTQSENVR